MRVSHLGVIVRSCLLAVILIGGFSGISLAGPNPQAKILLHLLTALPQLTSSCLQTMAQRFSQLPQVFQILVNIALV